MYILMYILYNYVYVLYNFNILSCIFYICMYDTIIICILYISIVNYFNFY